MALFLRVSSVVVSLPIIGRQHATLEEAVVEIATGKWTLAAFLAVNQNLIQVDHLARRTVVSLVIGVIGEVLIRHCDQVCELLVAGQLVQNVAYCLLYTSPSPRDS